MPSATKARWWRAPPRHLFEPHHQTVKSPAKTQVEEKYRGKSRIAVVMFALSLEHDGAVAQKIHVPPTQNLGPPLFILVSATLLAEGKEVLIRIPHINAFVMDP
jgi:hypothetical protein